VAIPLKKKETIVGGISEKVSEENALILVDYMGLKVSQISALRKRMRGEGITVTVAKNTLVRRAVQEKLAESDALKKFVQDLKGPTAVVFAPGDPISAARHVCEFLKTNDKLKLKGGYYAGKYVDKAGVDALSRLGSREEIVGKLLMALKGPMYKLVHGLKGPSTKLAGTLKAVKDKQD
jgi:large subunit ribosomal protein L10